MDDEYLKYENQIKERYLDAKIQKTINEHKEYIRRIIENQSAKYDNLSNEGFFDKSHEIVQMYEFKHCIDYLRTSEH